MGRINPWLNDRKAFQSLIGLQKYKNEGWDKDKRAHPVPSF